MGRIYRWPTLIVGCLWMMAMIICLPAGAQVKESTDFESLKINGHHYLFSKMNACVSYTVSIDTANLEVPVVEYNSDNRDDLCMAISEAVNYINEEKEAPEYLDWQEYIVTSCGDVKKELYDCLSYGGKEYPKIDENIAKLKYRINDILSSYERLTAEIDEYKCKLESGEELYVKVDSDEKNARCARLYDRIPIKQSDCPRVTYYNSSSPIKERYREYIWEQYKEWDDVFPSSISLSKSKGSIGATLAVMQQKCEMNAYWYVQDMDKCLSVLTDSISEYYEKPIKNLERDFNRGKKDNQLTEEDCLNFLLSLQEMNLAAIAEIWLNRLDAFKDELNINLENLEQLVDNYIELIDIWIDFYTVFPEKVIEYRDWLQSIYDMVMSWPADFRGMIEENAGVVEFPESITYNEVEYILFKIEHAFYNGPAVTKVILPKTIQYLSYLSLWNSDLAIVESHNPLPPIMESPYVFYFYFKDFSPTDYVGICDTAVLVVPDGCKDAYISENTELHGKNGYWWYLFNNIKTFSEFSGVDSINADSTGLYFHNGVLTNENCLEIVVYDIAGRVIYGGHDREVPITQKGLLIVRTASHTIKIFS